MSNKVQGLIWDIDFPNVPAKMVALKMADNAHDDGTNIYPASSTTALMTGCARSVVLKWVYAMEHCGMLLVEKRSAGGRNGVSTRRYFDMDLLRRLAWVDRRKNIPPQQALRLTTVVRPTQKKGKGDQLLFDGDSKLVTVPVFQVIPWSETVREADTSSVRETDSSGDQLSARRTGTVRQTDGICPSDGHEPFIDQSWNPPARPETLMSAEAGRMLIPFGGTDVSAMLAEGAAAAKAMRDGPERLPFTSQVLLDVQKLGVNAKQLVERYFERTKPARPSATGRCDPRVDGAGNKIKDASAYLMRMAREEAAKTLGVPASILQQATAKDPKVRAHAQAVAVGAGDAVSLHQAMAQLGASIKKGG